jgi:hypothetical protein
MQFETQEKLFCKHSDHANHDVEHTRMNLSLLMNQFVDKYVQYE